MADIKIEVGKRIRKTRKGKGLTQKGLGEKLGVADSVVTNYESGKQNLTIETLQKIAQVLEVDISVFFM